MTTRDFGRTIPVPTQNKAQMSSSDQPRFKVPSRFARDARVPLPFVLRGIIDGKVKTAWVGKRLCIDTDQARDWLDNLPDGFATAPPFQGQFAKRQAAQVLPFSPQADASREMRPLPERSRPPPGRTRRLRLVVADDGDPPRAA